MFHTTIRCGKFPIAFLYLFASVTLAQNTEEVKALRKSVDSKGLEVLTTRDRKTLLSTTQLQRKAKQLNTAFSGFSNGKQFELQGFDKNNIPMYYVSHNTGAALGTSTDKLNSTGGFFNLDGDGMRIFEWDGGGVLTTHQELKGRVTQEDGALSLSDHSTHVAGTMIASGVDAAAKGMAPKAHLSAYDWNRDEIEMKAAANNGALVSNHSYGYDGGFSRNDYRGSGTDEWYWMGEDSETEYVGYGYYGSEDISWDLISLVAPHYLPVRAAGNPRGDGPTSGEYHYVRINNSWTKSYKVREVNGGDDGFDCLMNGANAKNIMVVGAAHKINGGYQKPSDVKAASFSAFGPTDDGRIKPDIAGVGMNLYSSYSTGNNAYGSTSGTSMASPNVTGSLALLQEHYKKLYGTKEKPFMKSATLKALALHTANEAGPHPGPDYMFGWGLLNAFDAAKTLSTKGTYSLVEEETLHNRTAFTKELTASGSEPLKVTIVWDDPVLETVSLPDYTLNNRKSVLVNDLDIKIYDGSNTYLPWVLDPEHPAEGAKKADNARDNVEQIVIENPTPGRVYTLKITHKEQLKKNDLIASKTTLVNADTQDFSLIASGLNIGVTKDLSLKSISIPDTSQYSDNTPVTIEIANVSTDVISEAKLNYKLINLDNNDAVEQENSVTLGNIAAGSTLSQSVTINLSKSLVNYRIDAEVVADGDQIAVNNKNSASAFGTLADLRAKGSSYAFGFEDTPSKHGWTTQDLNNDNNTWQQYSGVRYSHTGNSSIINAPGGKYGTNDWLFSNPIRVKPNSLYSIEFFTKKFNSSIEEDLEIFFGTSADATAMKTQIGNKINTTTNYTRFNDEFRTPADSDIIYIGFLHKAKNSSTQNMAVSVDDVKVRFAEGTPTISFQADKVHGNSYTPITFTQEILTSSSQPVKEIKWSFSPATVAFTNNTNANSENPQVLFKKDGTYSVTLSATNIEGTSSETKTDYITISNTATIADFKASTNVIEEGETITFTNNSTGDPAPSEFVWSITPDEGIEYTSGTTKNSPNPMVKFNKYGTFTVVLTAKSAHNEDTKTQTDLISVTSSREGVSNLTGKYNDDRNQITLNWKRPFMRPDYIEDFEGATVPVDMTVIDSNKDNRSWSLGKEFKKGKQSIVSRSWTNVVKGFNTDDWLVTPLLHKGAESLKFFSQHRYPERYDVYIVKAPANGEVPTVEEMKNAKKVYTVEGGRASNLTEKEIDIKPYTDKDFFVAFHHRTLAKDNGYGLVFDDIQVGYRNGADSTQRQAETTLGSNVDYKAIAQNNFLPSEESELIGVGSEEIKNKTFGVTNTPKLTSYTITRDGSTIATVDTPHQLTYTDSNVTKGNTYTYTVTANYDDNLPSDARTVVVDTSELSTSETTAHGNTLKIYPNPSNGHFTIEAGNGISILKTEVYDMVGKLIFTKDFKGYKAEIELTQYPKGVYLLNVTNNNGEKQAAKLIIK